MNIIALLLTCLAPALQDSWRDTHRVHLRNGQFLDGRVEEVGEKEILFRWNPSAVLRIRRMEISGIEELKIRPLVQVTRKPVVRIDKPVVSEGPEPADGPKDPPKDPSKETPPAPRAETDADKVISRLLVDPNANLNLMMKELRALGPEGARSMIAGLPSMDSQRTEIVLVAIDAMRDVPIESEIRGLLEAKRPDLRAAACRLLAGRGATGTIRSIVPVLKDGSPEVRAAAVAATAALGDEGHLEVIAILALDPDAAVRARAFRGAEELSARLKLDNDLVARWLALAGRGPRNTQAEFIAAMGRLADRAGEGFPKKDLEGRLVDSLGDRDDGLRASAAQALGSLKGSESAAEAILRAMETESQPKVLMAMCDGLGRLKMIRAIEPLIELLRSDVAEVRSAALRALEKTTGATGPGTDADKWKEWYKESRKADGR